MSSPMIKNESKPPSPLLSDKADIQSSLISDTANYFEDILSPNNGKNCTSEHRHSKKNGCKKRWFTAHEKSVLQRLVLDNESVILSRRNDGVSVHLKKEVWLGIAEKFNSHPQTLTQRNSVELRRCWENMKFKAKKTLHRVQRHIEAARASSQCLGLPFTAGASPRTAAEGIIGLADVFSPRQMNNVVENTMFDDATAGRTRAVEAPSKEKSVEDLDTNIKSDDQVTKVSVFNSTASVMSISPFFCLSSATLPDDAKLQLRNSPPLMPSSKSESIFLAPVNLSCDAPFLAPNTTLKIPISSTIPGSETTLHFPNDSHESLKISPVNGNSFQPQNFSQLAVESDMIVDHDNCNGELSSSHANQSQRSECTSPLRALENSPSEGNLDACIGAQDAVDVLQGVAAPPLLPAMSALFSVLEGQTMSVSDRPSALNTCEPNVVSCSAASPDGLDVCLDLSKKSHVHCIGDGNKHELNNPVEIAERNISSPIATQDSDCTGNNDAKYVLCEDGKDESEHKKSAVNLNNVYFSYLPFGLDIHSLPSCFGPLSGTNPFRLTDDSNAAFSNASVFRSLLSSGTSRTLLRAAGQDTDRSRMRGNWTSSVPPRVTTGKPLNCEASLNNLRRDEGESLVFQRLLKTLNNISKIVPAEKFNDPVHGAQDSNRVYGEEYDNTKGVPPANSRLASEHVVAENIIFENTLLCQRLRLLQEQLQEVSGEHLQKMRLMQEEHRERLALFHEELNMKRMACQVMLEKALRSAK